MMQEERDTVTRVLQLVVTVDANIEDCMDIYEWEQEISYAINYKASEKLPEQAQEKGFNIGVGITNLPAPCEPNRETCCADCEIVEDPRACPHQCNPLRDGDVDWEQPSICAFYNDSKCVID